jgi:arylsulfatase A-like enzyme
MRAPIWPYPRALERQRDRCENPSAVSAASGVATTVRVPRLALALAVTLGACSTCQPTESGATSQAPGTQGSNVILVSIDTLRPDHLGCYGYPKPTSPNIDRLARESVLFRTAIAHAPSTTPSHASIFTSLIPARHLALRAFGAAISPGAVTMAEHLQRAGYRTVSYNGGGQVSAAYGFDRGFETYESRPGASFREIVAEATRWLDAHEGERFFMFLHTYEVHAPYAPDARHLALFDADYAGELPSETSPRLLIEINDGKRQVTPRDIEHIVATYDAEIRSMDEGMGGLVDRLRRGGLDRRTLLVFTSDHGEEFGEHGQIGKHSHTLYDEVLRVPLVLRFPDRAHAGRSVREPVRGVDIMPTVLEVLGLKAPNGLDGASVLDLLGTRQRAPGPAVAQIDLRSDPPPRAIRTERDKFIDPGAPGAQEYYDLAQDPGERRNLALDAERHARVAALRRQIEDAWPTRSGSVRAITPARVNPDTERQLRALGYTGR